MSSKLLSIVISVSAAAALAWGNEPLSLSRAYAMALQNEPNLQALALKTNATAEGVEQSRAKLYPHLQGSLAYGRYEYAYNQNTAPTTKENYGNYSVSASQPLFHPEQWRGIDEAQSREKSARYQFQSKAQELGTEVAKAYFDVLRAHRSIELLASQKEYYESKYRQLEEMLKFGLTNRIDLLDAKIHRDGAVSEWLNEQRKLKVAQMHLQFLTGEEVGELPQFDFTALDATMLFQDRAAWESKLPNNPALIASKAVRDMSRDEVAVRQYGHYPKADFSLMRKETYSNDPLVHKYDNQAVVQMVIPIYEGGETQSRVRESLLLAQSAQKELDAVEQKNSLRFEELWADHELNAQSLSQSLETEKSAQLYVESMEKAYAVGLKSVVDVLDAKAKLYKIKRDSLDAGYHLVDNYLGVLDVSGELNSDNIAIIEKMMISTGVKL
jgi:outer membrane protein